MTVPLDVLILGVVAFVLCAVAGIGVAAWLFHGTFDYHNGER
jgi:hypothetical protein